MGPLSLPIALLLSLCMLVLLLTPTASALGATRVGSDGGHESASVMMQCEDGKVTDEDGRIGNGSRGADRAPAQDDFARGILADGSTPDAPTMPGEAARMHPQGDAVVQDGAQPQDGISSATEQAAMEAGRSGILGWIIGILVLLAVVLVVLALVPKKNRSR